MSEKSTLRTYRGLMDGQVALVTGAGKGIGEAVVKAFAEAGTAAIYAVDNVEGSIEDTAKILRDEYGCHVETVYFDVSDQDKGKQLFLRIMKESGKLDTLVNNAGVMKDALVGTVTREIIDYVYETNVFAMMFFLQNATKLMMKKKRGSIINLSSIVGITGNPGQLVYSSSKGAVIAMTKTAAKEVGIHNIRVNAIAPGMIDTDMMRSVGEKILNGYIENIPFGRLGEPHEIADACVFLASPMSTYVSGQILAVDGCVLV